MNLLIKEANDTLVRQCKVRALETGVTLKDWVQTAMREKLGGMVTINVNLDGDNKMKERLEERVGTVHAAQLDVEPEPDFYPEDLEPPEPDYVKEETKLTFDDLGEMKVKIKCWCGKLMRAAQGSDDTMACPIGHQKTLIELRREGKL